MSPIQWAVRPLKRYAAFSGRAPRAEFWWFFLFMMVIWLAMYFVMLGSLMAAGMSRTEPSAGFAGAFGIFGIAMVLFWLGLLIPSIAVQVRRLHDTNRSGWWLGSFYLLYAVYVAMLLGSVGSMMAAAMAGAQPDPSQAPGTMFGATMILGLVMFVYMIVLLVFYCLAGTTGPNRYGPDPNSPGSLEEVFA